MDLSDDNELAFLQLIAEFKEEFAEKLERPDASFEYDASEFMNKVIAAATALGIDAISSHEAPRHGDPTFGSNFTDFQRDLDHIIVQLRIHHARRKKRLSVGLSAEQKTKIHAFIEKIRTCVEGSDAGISKKEKIFQILGALTVEIDRERTRFEYFADLARGLASEFARSGVPVGVIDLGARNMAVSEGSENLDAPLLLASGSETPFHACSPSQMVDILARLDNEKGVLIILPPPPERDLATVRKAIALSKGRVFLAKRGEITRNDAQRLLLAERDVGGRRVLAII
jgi:hypothetical protein